MGTWSEIDLFEWRSRLFDAFGQLVCICYLHAYDLKDHGLWPWQCRSGL